MSATERASLEDARSESDPITVLADVLNQVAMVVSEVGYYASQHGYLDTTDGRRRRWKETLDKQRDRLAELIPE